MTNQENNIGELLRPYELRLKRLAEKTYPSHENDCLRIRSIKNFRRINCFKAFYIALAEVDDKEKALQHWENNIIPIEVK